MRTATRAGLILTSLPAPFCSRAPAPVSAGSQVQDEALLSSLHATTSSPPASAPESTAQLATGMTRRARQISVPEPAPSAVPSRSSAPAVRTTRGPRVLSRPRRGTQAIEALGDRLDRVAERNRLSPQRLRTILREDPAAWVATRGDLYYVEHAPEEVTGGAEQAAPAPAHSTDRTFSLHSRPGASRTVFLDFDGASVENTAWNGSGPGDIANGTHAGWDSDGSPSTFTTAEHGWIQEVWRQVAETYSPFDVDVTTEDLGAASWIRSSSTDRLFGTHVLVTSSASAKAQACGGCLGVAWVGTFDHVDPSGYYQPAWVFADNPGFDPTIVAQAASHEAGHTLGLHHDGTLSQSYYAGTAAWGPLMGSARTRAVSQFSKGEYSGASNTEDDFAVMQSYGLPLRADDHGSTIAGAVQLGQRASYDVSGVIGTRSDTDVFALMLGCTADLVVAATGIGPQTMLDLSVEILDPAGGRLAYASPASTYGGTPPTSAGMDAQVSLSGATGTVYVRVDGVANGNPAGSGWSDYGSLGQYRLTATGCADDSGGGSTGGVTTFDPSGDQRTEPTANPLQDPSPSEPPAAEPPRSSPPPVTRPSAPRIGTASSGTAGGPVTAVTRWSPPASAGGAPVTQYRVRAQRRDSAGRVVEVTYSAFQKASARSLSMSLRRGSYTFTVTARNSVGASAWSGPSRTVLAR